MRVRITPEESRLLAELILRPACGALLGGDAGVPARAAARPLRLDLPVPRVLPRVLPLPELRPRRGRPSRSECIEQVTTRRPTCSASSSSSTRSSTRDPARSCSAAGGRGAGGVERRVLDRRGGVHDRRFAGRDPLARRRGWSAATSASAGWRARRGVDRQAERSFPASTRRSGGSAGSSRPRAGSGGPSSLCGGCTFVRLDPPGRRRLAATGAIDAIFCCNVLMYLSSQARAARGRSGSTTRAHAGGSPCSDTPESLISVPGRFDLVNLSNDLVCRRAGLEELQSGRSQAPRPGGRRLGLATGRRSPRCSSSIRASRSSAAPPTARRRCAGVRPPAGRHHARPRDAGDGRLAFLRVLMAKKPLPVIVVRSNASPQRKARESSSLKSSLWR